MELFKMGVALPILMLSTTIASPAIHPSDQAVAGLGDTATFTCIATPMPDTVEWLIDDEIFDFQHHSGVTQENMVRLQIRNISAEYNNTRIQCKVNTTLSPPSTLLVQGLLSAVGSLLVGVRADHTYVNWTAPFTLDITATRVDITYCVDVVSSSSATLHSECGITVTEFTYPLPPMSWCHEYNLTVTPVNVVGNGTKNSMLYLQDIPGPPHLMEVNVGNSDVSLVMSSPVCQAKMSAKDLHTKDILRELDVTIAEANISFPSQLLMLNRLYSLTVSANNTGGQIMSEEKISTHDIINCTIKNNSDSISISVKFTEHSEATGALLHFIFITDDGVIDLRRSICLSADKTNVSQGLTLPLNMWYSGQYKLYVYDIESSKKIMNGIQYEASNGTLTVTNGRAGSPSPTSFTNCSVYSDAGVITVACSFSRFQVTAQRNALDSVNILHVNTSMDPQTPVTLQVTENGEYLLTILPVQDGRGIMSSEMQTQIISVNDAITTQSPVSSNSTIPCIVVGTVLGLVCLAVVVILVIILILKISCNKKALKKRENVYVEAQVIGRSDSITVRMSRSGPFTTTTTTQDAEPAYAMVHDVSSDVRSYSPADVEESSVHQGSVQPENTQGYLEEVVTPTYSESMVQSEKGMDFSFNSATLLISEPNESLAASHLTSEGQNAHSVSPGNHYVALDHPKMAASSDVIDVHLTSSENAIPAGYKNGKS